MALIHNMITMFDLFEDCFDIYEEYLNLSWTVSIITAYQLENIMDSQMCF